MHQIRLEGSNRPYRPPTPRLSHIARAGLYIPISTNKLVFPRNFTVFLKTDPHPLYIRDPPPLFRIAYAKNFLYCTEWIPTQQDAQASFISLMC